MDARRTRLRSVKLTEAGRSLLVSAIEQKWLTERPGVRPTGESKADFFGLSVGTTKKLLKGAPVDLATVELAFLKLDLCLEEAYWTRDPDRPQGEDEDRGTHSPEPAAPLPQSEESSLPARPKRRLPGFLAIGLTGAVLLSLTVIAAMPQSSEVVILAENERANAFIAQGTRSFQAGRYGEAEKAFSSAMEIAVKRDLTGLAAESSRMMGDVASAVGDLELSRQRYLTALRLRESGLGFREMAGKSFPSQVLPPLHEALGVVESKLGNWTSAEKHLKQALDGFRRFKDVNGTVMALRDLGAMHYRRKQFELSANYFNQAMEALEPQELDSDLAWDVRARRTLAMADLGKAEDALDILTLCLQHWEKKGHVKWQAETRVQLAHASLLSNRHESALEHLERAVLQFRQVGDLRNLRMAAKLQESLPSPKASSRLSSQTVEP